MISFNELLGKHSISDVPLAIQQNMDALLKAVNVIRAAWSKPMTVTSGFRDWNDMLRIYRAKGVKDDKIPRGSAHLSGLAVDISDPDLAITHWLKTDPHAIVLLEQQGLYCEEGNSNWVHLQLRASASGNRWFKP